MLPYLHIPSRICAFSIPSPCVPLRRRLSHAPGELNGIITNSAVAFLTRAGNPKQISTWKDLVKPGVTVVTANPKTSGGARWNFLELWGSITQAGGTPQQAEAYITSVYTNVDRKGTRKAAEALAAYLFSDEAQQVFAEEGFRPTSPSVWTRVKDRFAPVKTFFSVKDFGGWSQVNKEFFSDGGIWDHLFANTR
ncbi:MAG: substrate-binding domain-containing protein [Cyanobacteriota bacterium]|nr:substrate-binding domain-containing protein [Cyanobacteriota bacterium]